MGKRLGVAPIDPASSHSIARGKAWVYLDLSLSPTTQTVHASAPSPNTHMKRVIVARCRLMGERRRESEWFGQIVANPNRRAMTEIVARCLAFFWLFENQENGFFGKFGFFGYWLFFLGILFLMGERPRERPIEMLPSGVGSARKAPQDLWTTKKVT